MTHSLPPGAPDSPASSTRNECRQIGFEKYCGLLLDRRPLARLHDRSGRVRGLVDPQTGRRYVISEEDFNRAILTRRVM
jgi:hypothetical protein